MSNRTLVAITGASSGIGEAFARRLAAQHDLLLIARREDRLQALADDLERNSGSRPEILPADLADESQTGMVAERLSDRRLVLLVNNAGFGAKGRFWESPLEVQEQMHRLHVMATVRLTHAALQNLTAQSTGGVINVASVAAFLRSQGSVSYCATKSWLAVFTEGLYLELKAVGSPVRVQALCPGFTYSEFHDAMGVQRTSMAGKSLWHTSEFVVDASLDGLARNKLIVVPGWRYRLITAVTSKLPTAARLGLEHLAGQRRGKQLLSAPQPQSESKSISKTNE